MKQYKDLVEHVLTYGTRKPSRTGVDTILSFGYHYTIDLSDGFPLLTTKRMSWKNIVVENLWFLFGEDSVDFLHRHDVRFWDAWTSASGRIPSAYGHRWRAFKSGPADWVDQVSAAIAALERDPFSRRAVVMAWDPRSDFQSALPPCHYTFALNVQMMRCGRCDGDGWIRHQSMGGPSDERCPINCQGGLTPRLCCHVTQRSADIALGVPYNIAGYAFLTELFAHRLGMQAGLLSHTLVDAHIYTAGVNGEKAEYDHVPGLRNQIDRVPRQLPTLRINGDFTKLGNLDHLRRVSTDTLLETFRLEGYYPHDPIAFKVAV